MTLRSAYIKYLLCLTALFAAWLHGFATCYGLSLEVIKAVIR